MNNNMINGANLNNMNGLMNGQVKKSQQKSRDLEAEFYERS